MRVGCDFAYFPITQQHFIQLIPSFVTCAVCVFKLLAVLQSIHSYTRTRHTSRLI